jgi:two-component system response regulator HydG
MTVERVLIADPDVTVLDQIGGELTAHGYEVFPATHADELRQHRAARRCDVALIDLDLPGGRGLGVAHDLAMERSELCVAVMGPADRLSNLADELLDAHFGMLAKPVTTGQALLTIEQVLELRRLREENHMLRRQWEEDEGPDDLVAHSPEMVDVLRQAATIADTDRPVLVCGPPGTETEIVALYIHRCSQRANGPFIRFECGRASAAREEADLFGRHYEGPNAAVWRGSGRIDLAARGTLFLEHITALAPAAQAKLLRFIDEGQFLRADAQHFGLAAPREGAQATPTRADVRIVCASSHHPDELSNLRRLRHDLLFRLSPLSITIPPLTRRLCDIRPLAERVLRRVARETGQCARRLSPDAARALEEYDWPGNVAELRDTIRAAVLGADHPTLTPEDLLRGPSRRVISGVISGASGPSLEDAERQVILQTLRETGGNQTEAARRLCVAMGTLRNRLARYRSRGLMEAAPPAGTRGKPC